MAMSMAGFSLAIMKPALSNGDTSPLKVPVCVRHGLAPLNKIDSDVPHTLALHANMKDCASKLSILFLSHICKLQDCSEANNDALQIPVMYSRAQLADMIRMFSLRFL